MKLTWRTELPALAVLVAIMAVAAWQWPQLPERLPVHWGMNGQPDRWGGRAEALLFPPGIALFLYAVLSLAPRWDPGRANYERFAGAYLTLRLAVLGFQLGLQSVMIATFHGARLNMNTLLCPLVGTLLVIVGGVMGKLRPNWFVGIRTPWTLSSKLSWSATHRAGGWAFIGSGLLWIAAGLSGSPRAILIGVAVTLASAAALIVYSYVVWRRDPDPQPPAGTSPASEG